MGFKRLPAAAFEVGKATSMSLWMIVRRNFSSHESRILNLEGSPQAIVTGMITNYAGSSAPTGWLICDGSAIDRTTYSALFTKIGTTYGAGDGSTTFNVPDFRGRVLVGYGAGSGLTSRSMGASGGNETHTLSTAELPVHTHTVTDPGHLHDGIKREVTAGGANVGPQLATSRNSSQSRYVKSNTTGISIGNTGGGGSHPNVQPCLVLNFIIKT